MASFTDKTPTFNPYVSQQPVDAMVKVGMMKQQQYDTNVQKIQQSMTEIAGLQIARDVDKDYLNQKISDVNSELKIFAAGDFSSNNLTTSMKGMISGISNDDNIINAVRSTMAAQNAKKLQAEYTKSGKSSASNDWMLDTELQAWYNNPEVGATFSGTYKPYADYKKKTLDIIKELTADETITDDAFHYEGNKLVIHDAIVREKMAGISPEKIQQALMSGLNPSEWDQMSVDGRYTYANVDGATFGNRIQEQYNLQIADLEKNKTTLQGSLDDITNLQEKNAVRQEIKIIDNEIDKSNRKYKGILEAVNSGNYEAAKATMYTNDYIHGISQAFSSVERSRTIENNPYAEMAFKRKKLSNDYAMWAKDYNLDVAKFQQDAIDASEDRKIKREANRLKGQELTGFNAGGGLPSSIPKQDLPEKSIGTITNKIAEREKQITDKDDEFSANRPAGWLEQRILNFEKTGQSGDPALNEWLGQRRSLQTANSVDQIAVLEIQKEADEKFGKIQDKISEEDNSISFNSDGINLTVEDIVKFNSKKGKFLNVNVVNSLGGSSYKKEWDDEGAATQLNEKEHKLYEIWQKDSQREALTLEEEEILNGIKEYDKKYNKPFKDVLEEKNEFINKEATSRVSVTQGVDYSFEMKAADLNAYAGGKLTTIANLMGETGEGFPEFEGTVEQIQNVAKNVKTATMKVIEANDYQDAKYIFTATNTDGKTVRIPLNETQKTSLFGGIYENKPEVRAAQVYDNQIRKLTGKEYGSTSLDGKPTNVSNSLLHGKQHFPQINAYGISGNVEKTESGLYSVKINIFDPVAKTVFAENVPWPRTGLLSKEMLTTALNSLTDERIFEMIYGQAPGIKIDNEQDLRNLFKE